MYEELGRPWNEANMVYFKCQSVISLKGLKKIMKSSLSKNSQCPV
jgi:hypothetical protein